MNTDSDKAFRSEAIKLLESQLRGVGWTSKIDKKKLLSMFVEIKSVQRQKNPSKKLLSSSQSLFETLVRVVRCLCIDDPKAKMTTIRGREVEMNANDLFLAAEKEYKNMRELSKR